MLLLSYVLLTLHMFVGLVLIGLILLQRGRGGGLAGAFGGMGGQSAFGTKAGDVFTRITIVAATIWITLACICILVVSNATGGRFKPGAADTVIKAPPEDKKAMPANEAEPAAEKKGDGAPAEKNDAAETDTKPAKSEKPAAEKAKEDEKPTTSDPSAENKPE
jgi:preprotein translocase subunit SecG